MKKYVKPDLYYENFELSHNVASCHQEGSTASEVKSYATASSEYSCTYNLFGDTLFQSDNCPTTLDSVGWEDYCYQTGSATISFFSS